MPTNVVHPVIVIPGITATYLTDEYPFEPDTVWGLLTKKYERLTPHPDDLRYEALEPSQIRTSKLNSVAYRELVAELRHNLSPRADEPTPVFTFAYDWRFPLDRSVEALHGFIEEVIGRTRLLKHYDAVGWQDEPRVNLVAHSMGGLIAAGYLGRFGDERRVSKVASLATPFNGSFEAVLKIAVGTGDLGSGAPSSRERETSRMLPSLYHLLPTVPDGVQADPGLETDLFSPDAWQTSVVKTIAEFIRLHGLNPDGNEQQARALFTEMLTRARDYRAGVETLDLAVHGLSREDWLCVAGVNVKTRVRLRVRDSNGQPDFVLSSADRENRWVEQPRRPEAKRRAEQRFTGDGTVPFDGAVPQFLERKNVVCVTPQDFGYWELGDRVLNRAAGFHGIMPNMNMLHRLIVRHFTGASDSRGMTWGRPAPGVSPGDWNPAVPGLRNKDLKR